MTFFADPRLWGRNSRITARFCFPAFPLSLSRSKMLNGKCLCGQIEYTLDEDSRDGILCQCRTCQVQSTDRSFNLKSSPDKLKVTKGQPKVWVDENTDSGNAVERNFCGNCGSSLWSVPRGIPGVVFVKVSADDVQREPDNFTDILATDQVGPLQQAKDIKLAGNIYVDTGIPSIALPKDAPCKQFEGMMKKEVSA